MLVAMSKPLIVATVHLQIVCHLRLGWLKDIEAGQDLNILLAMKKRHLPQVLDDQVPSVENATFGHNLSLVDLVEERRQNV